ncbi:LamG domain-containing protein [Longitalea arenae]|uniref:LamG domain-containing protein n=1 Tax=Longitalea arenae TaxID=2812558 RepID=UPI001967EE3F|nr:LamG domain-containing protein [Longitalea arenae]
MKKVSFFLCTLLALAVLAACEKECEECKECDLTKDSTCNTDTIYIPPPPDISCKVNLSKGLLAYYPFNGNFNDESGNGNNATAKNGAVITTDFLGRPGGAAGFDGINDYLIVPGSSKLNADSITVSFQIFINNTNRYYAAISRLNFETAQSAVFNVHQSSVTDTFWTFSVPPGTDNCTRVYTTYDSSIYAFSKGPIKAGRWYNIVVSFAGGVQKIYIDGVLEASKTRPASSAKKCDNADLVIGGHWKNDIMSLDGKMDEVRLYNRVLNDCEIDKLAHAWK